MKRILLIDCIREIKANLSRFLAIVSIVALSVAFFTGINLSCPNMKFTGDTYFDEQNLMDFRLISTVGFNRKDIEYIKNIEGVNGVMPSYTVDVMAEFKNKERVVRVHSLPQVQGRNARNYINRPMVISGRLPEHPGECVVEEGFLENINIGQKFSIDSGVKDKSLTTISHREYIVVGIVRSPIYISRERGNSTIGSGKVSSFMFINEDDFDLPVHNEIYLTVEGGIELDTYSDEYKAFVATMEVELEGVADRIVEERYSEILNNATIDYNIGFNRYNSLLKSSISQIADSEEEYNRGVLELDIAFLELQSNKDRLDKEEQLHLNEIEMGKQQVISQISDINNKIENIKSAILSAQISGNSIQEAQLESNLNQLISGRTQLHLILEDLTKQNLDVRSRIAQGRIEISYIENEIIEARQELRAAKKFLDEGRKKLSENLFVANKDLTDALEDIRGLDEVKWHILGRDKNIGFADYENAANTMDAISKVFPILFVFVALLICITTMGRLVDEQRGYMGTLKALGYSSIQIASKYLIYASTASIIGCIVGIAIGFTLLPNLLFEAYRYLYTMPDLLKLFDWKLALLCILVAVSLTSFAAFYVCKEELYSNAAKLLRPKAQKPGTKIFLERIDFVWSRLKFTQKVTARNLFRYKSRFLMTVIGISGCTALLVVGLGIRDAVTFIGENQYTTIFKYDIAVILKEELDENLNDVIVKDIENIRSLNSYGEFMTLNVTGEGAISKDATLIVPKDEKKINEFISLHSRRYKENINLSDEGIVVSEKLAKLLDLSVGGDVFVKVDEYDGYNIKVTAITENYMEHYMYISQDLFESIFVDEEIEWNSIYINLNDSSEENVDKIASRLLEKDGITSVVKSYNSKNILKDMVGSIDFIVMLLIIAAGLLSFVVLYTLTNINVSERMREIATIKVLGFYNKETASYVFRENIILAIIGGLLGLIIGYFLWMYIIVTVEVEMLMFGRRIKIFSYVISMIITMIFTIIVNWIMLRKVKNINMVEALKTVE